MPTRAIQHEDDLFVRTGSHLPSKGGELDLKERDTDGAGEVKDRAPRRRMHEADQIAPFKALLHRSQRSLAVETPDLVQDRLEANAVFVDGPHFHLGLRKGGRYRSRERTELFLKAWCSAAFACTWRGRGLRRLPSRRTR